MHVRQLSVEERAELDEAVSDPARFHSDGREIGQAAIIIPAVFIPFGFLVAHDLQRSLRAGADPFAGFIEFFPDSLIWLFSSAEFLEVIGIVAIAVISIAVPAYWFRTRNRHGYAVTSFGVVRVRGPKLRLLRYEDIAETIHGERRYPRHRVITDELEIKAKDGKSLVLYGFGLRAWQRRIEARRAEL